LPRIAEDLTGFSLSAGRNTAFYLIDTEIHLYLSRLKEEHLMPQPPACVPERLAESAKISPG